ncbi:uncharacterized protein Z518_04806 [Rhinocladiella mackenziei CBS 650.93]|uniref:Rhinocladiella mackenziei CBS 650.93 unplaced genomic scaffold supercont1.3, whole genome shotgun sequence n=1 Tax=Rhinocladiella mackenziei CBS 650.93 TaxID=1442369 RepID=A0A0D2JCI8_9EURO|nr:uncharacterized protein Z518_04806 [Rhinocladiella mackenziei CBS 650.93]KIX06830.1 hypothetical protein Z518_04806 [Rhinocladiella mackenziei CBS 650.93]
MANTADEVQLRRLLRRYRVFYDLDDRQAPVHDAYFEDIQKLGEHNIDEYRSNITIESRQRPWRQDILSRAKAISAKARRCLEANKNEASWRLSIESEILARFSVEVVCSDEGLNPLFDDRADEEIEHPSEIEKILKIGKKPDRLIGLRVTRRLDRILNQTEGPQGDLIGDSIKTSPFKHGCQPLLFPFILLEAKSEKSPDAFSKINLQTGFAIRALLELQRNLAHATVENRQSGMKPLVWFLSYRGESWRLSGAYVEEREAEPNYHILQLWEGNIIYEHQALRLLLILDYIFDWARDVYRKEIISSLLSLAVNASPSLAEDTDVFSTFDQLNDIGEMPELDTDDITEQIEPFGVPQLLKFFDNQDIAFRDARYMHHKVCALHVTLANLDKFLYSVRTMKEAKLLARKLWRSIRGQWTWSVTAECLNIVEKLWTDKERELHAFQNPEQLFLVSFAVESYLAHGEQLRPGRGERAGQWDQIHRLSYIAIAHDALPALRERTKLSPRSLQVRIEDCPKVPTEWVVDLFERMRFAPVRQSLAAAIIRSRLGSESYKSSPDKQDGFATCPDARGRVKYFAPALTKSEGSSVLSSAELPWVIYNRLKIGMTEPSESFLRVSQHFGKHDTDRTCSRRANWARRTQSILRNYAAVLVAGVDGDDERVYSVRHCVFVLDLPPINENERGDTSSTAAVLPQVLRTFLRIRWNSVPKYNFRDVKWDRTEDLHISLQILEHVSTQYQLVHSLNPHGSPGGIPGWIKEKQAILSSSEKAKWPYAFLETIDGIKQVGESYSFGQILQYLIAAFQKVIRSEEAQSRLLEELNRLKHATEVLKMSAAGNSNEPPGKVDEADSNNDFATGSATSKSSSTGQSPICSHEVIVVDDTEDDIEGQTICSPESNIEEANEPVTKKRRLYDSDTEM